MWDQCLPAADSSHRPEELGEKVDGLHGVLVLLIEHEMAETPTVLRPRMLSRGFGGRQRKRRMKKDKVMKHRLKQHNQAFINLYILIFVKENILGQYHQSNSYARLEYA